MAETSVVKCVGIIMDGNRRWAKVRGLPVFEGHNEGYKKLQEIVRAAREARIPHLVAYTFSIENWQRSSEEVGYLMKLFRTILESETEKLTKEGVRVRFVGDRSRFGEDMQAMMRKMEKQTGEKYDITLHLLMSYGGRAEIAAAAGALLAEGAQKVTEEKFAQKLWAHPVPDPDIVIRTGGERRLSGFLPWQTVYSELFFTDTLWPDFNKEEFDSILTWYRTRKRNFGV
ncbi:di-trans,poly-cis-decaprenylcistransferase [Candidatus Kaiserbacteria bacterium]|nr:di-trans,poly-cis-decaprenylcistransferase [Candidatus Kaiserbacteria bacterium]